jgi:hypothetical protein
MVTESEIPNYRFNPDVLQKYRENDFLQNWLPNASEENEKNFWLAVNNAKKPVKRTITKIIRVKYYDTRGNEIPEHDTDAIHDIAEGRKVVYYHEEVVEKDEKKVMRKIR